MDLFRGKFVLFNSMYFRVQALFHPRKELGVTKKNLQTFKQLLVILSLIIVSPIDSNSKGHQKNQDRYARLKGQFYST